MEMLETKCVVWLKSREFEALSQALGRELALPVVTAAEPGTPFALCYASQGLQLLSLGKGAPGPVLVDFVSGKAQFRRLHGGGEMVCKAVGMQQKKSLRILDATAGLGRDAFVLASCGASVWLQERSPLIHALLRDGLQRAQQDSELAPIIARMQLARQNSISNLQAYTSEFGIEVIYLDPMFPEREKSALVKKEMRIFRELVGADEDAHELLDAALNAGAARVVVKRPRHAQCLAKIKPSHTLEGKSSRFDVYSFRKLG